MADTTQKAALIRSLWQNNCLKGWDDLFFDPLSIKKRISKG